LPKTSRYYYRRHQRRMVWIAGCPVVVAAAVAEAVIDKIDRTQVSVCFLHHYHYRWHS